MGKYRRYKNIVEMFLSSEKGKRVLNFCYSWGASIVILGALFKLLHLPYANQILFVAMITEAAVFFISAFERPNDEYHWEDVFPILKSKNPLDRPKFEQGEKGVSGMQTGIIGMQGGIVTGASVPNNTVAGAQAAASLGLDVTEEDAKNLSDSIKKLSGAAEQISKMAELTEATQKYLDQLSSMSEQMERFSQVTGSLTHASDTLLNAYQSIKSISMQIEQIEQINAGLNRIKEMYNNSVVDSSVFRSETEKMTQQLMQLNQVYSRLLQAMTINMNTPQQPTYQQPYQQGPMYGQQPMYQQPYK